MENQKIVFFDGVCSLCNFAVDFITQRNPQRTLKIASLQGETAQKMLDEELRSVLSSLVYFENGKIYTHSDAALRICKDLSFPWNLFPILLLVPRFLRDFVYKLIARNRYKMFGKRDTCRLPTKEEASYFLD